MTFADAVAADLRRIEAGDRFEGAEGARRWRGGLAPGTGATRYATYVEMGYYARQLERYNARFPADRIRVYFQEDMARDPLALVRDFWAYVGVDASRALDDDGTRNAARTLQRGRAEHAVARVARALGAHRFVPKAVWNAAKLGFRQQPAIRPPLDDLVRRELEVHFAAHDQALARLLGRPLPYRADRVG
jgi:hypothetical protein